MDVPLIVCVLEAPARVVNNVEGDRFGRPDDLSVPP
jgi:hypothetical protein